MLNLTGTAILNFGFKKIWSILRAARLHDCCNFLMPAIVYLISIQACDLSADENSENMIQRAQNFLEKEDFRSAISILEILSKNSDTKALN